MPQAALNFGATYHGSEAWEAQLEVLRSAVSHLGAKEVAFQLDINRSTVSESLHPPSSNQSKGGEPRYERRWAAEWTHTVKAMLAARIGDQVAFDLLKRLCETDVVTTPFIVDEPVEMTPEEEVAVERLLEKLRRRKPKK